MQKAFTLAEVLITLGVIGIVCALVLPTIISNIQDMHYTAMWKKKYSEIANAYNQAKNELSGNICVETKSGNFSNSVKCQKVENYSPDYYTTLSPEFVNKFVSYLKVIDSCGQVEYGESTECTNFQFKWIGYCNRVSAGGYYGSLAQNKGQKGSVSSTYCTTSGGLYTAWDMSRKAVLQPDGSVIYFGGHATGMISVDVNGFTKGPNVVGRDLFVVMVNEDWLKPIGAEGTFNKSHNGQFCECSKNFGLERGQGFLGSADLLNGQILSGTCCSATKLTK